MRWLDEEIIAYVKKDVYPFHMPGSKRHHIGLQDAYLYDITEIDGFDDLRHPTGVLAELQREWAELYGAGEAFLSVNGSTCGNLAMIFAASHPQDTILVAKQCHWSVYNAAALRNINVVELDVPVNREGFCEAIPPEAVESALRQHPGIRAVLITSPTYEGVVSDVAKIAELVHRYGAILLVDSAHGAHIGLMSGEAAEPQSGRPDSFPDPEELHIGLTSGGAAEPQVDRQRLNNPISQGADAVVVSLHKTLPVLGQTSLVLLPDSPGASKQTAESRMGNQRAAATENQATLPSEQIKKYLNMFQTSSPSYVLMSAAAAGCRLLQKEGRRLASELENHLAWFYKEARALNKLKIIDFDNKDRSKIVISTVDSEISGEELMMILRRDYRIELEKAGKDYALGIATVMDTQEGFERLASALREIDRRVSELRRGSKTPVRL